MPAPIVYDGVGGEEGGSLFRGVKFWIAQRVPQRSEWVKRVKENGGEVVPLEKQADMLIADHARKDAPPDSYSWRFLDNSIKNGQLEEKDDHLIGRPVGSSRPVASGAPAKGTRTKFTPEDDTLLAKWVLDYERKGYQTKGNMIYQDLEAKYPHHTFQSWRDRWVKKVSLLPRESLLNTRENQSPPSEPLASAVPSSLPPSAQPTTEFRAPSSPATRRRVQPSSTSRSRVFFTDEDDRILVQWVKQAVEAAEQKGGSANLKGNKIYQELEEEHPHHTFHSWRDRYLRYLSQPEEDGKPEVTDTPRRSPRVSQGSVQNDAPAVTSPPRPQEPNHRAAPETAQDSVTRESVRNSPASEAAPQPSSIMSTPAKDIRQEIAQRLEKQQFNRKKGIAAKTIQRVWRGYRVRRDLEEVMDKSVADQSRVEGHTAKPTVSPSLASDDIVEDEIEVKWEHPGNEDLQADDSGFSVFSQSPPPYVQSQFYKDLHDYIKITGHEIELWPSVHGHSIDLWDLFHAVTTEKVDLDHRDWEQVAEKLGLDWIQYSDIPQRVREIYEANLADFERSLLDFDEESDNVDESGLSGASEDEGSNNDEPISDIIGPASDSVQLPGEQLQSESHFSSSPPEIFGRKRSARAALLAVDTQYPSESSSKRARHTRDSEIPSTPDEKMGVARRNHVSTSIISNSGVKRSTNKNVSNFAETASLQVQVSKQVRKLRVVEPETQDFGYEPDFAEDDLRESQYGITPSQQLQMENDAVSPIPFALGGHSSVSMTVANRGNVDEDPFASTPPAHHSISPAFASAQDSSRTARSQSRGNSDGLLVRQAKRRSLPQSFVKSRRVTDLPTTQAAPRATSPTSAYLNPAHSRSSIVSSRAGDVVGIDAVPLSQREAPFIPRSQAVLSKSPSQEFHGRRPALEDVIEHYMSMGYPKHIVIKSYSATTQKTGHPMSEVLESLMKGQGIPRDVPGVWTQRDDDGLAMINNFEKSVSKGKVKAGRDPDAERQLRRKAERELARLEAKHGEDAVKARSDYHTVRELAGLSIPP